MIIFCEGDSIFHILWKWKLFFLFNLIEECKNVCLCTRFTWKLTGRNVKVWLFSLPVKYSSLWNSFQLVKLFSSIDTDLALHGAPEAASRAEQTVGGQRHVSGDRPGPDGVSLAVSVHSGDPYKVLRVPDKTQTGLHSSVPRFKVSEKGDYLYPISPHISQEAYTEYKATCSAKQPGL